MNCAICNTTEWINPEGGFTPEWEPVPVCAGCHETLVRVGTTPRVLQPKPTPDLTLLTVEELVALEALLLEEEGE